MCSRYVIIPLAFLLATASSWVTPLWTNSPQCAQTTSDWIGADSATSLGGFCRQARSRRTSLHLFGKKKEKEDGDGADDILNSPVFLKKKIDVLKKDCEEAEQDIKIAEAELRAAEEEWGEQMTRLKSEYDFIKARSFNETRDAGDVATVKVIKEVLGVVDNFNRAFGAIKYETDEGKAVEEDFRTVYNDIETLFKDLGVEEVETLGAEFDYECHEAITQMPSEDYDEGVVCQEFQKGYKLKETLIRPAMVAVAM
mmetsp:Transcript_3278/g.6676  ORF Transcript_3278/g.6676 Transcript_3278/m.6676 type:complete len:255 (+) Transcript_3278:11-775(+)